MSENGDAPLADVTNRLTQAQIDESRHAERAKTREAGWVEPVAYDYDGITSKPPDSSEGLVSRPPPIWASQARKYQWADEYGDVGPPDQELEDQLFKQDTILKKGKEYEKIAQIPVTFESKNRIAPVVNFDDAGLHPLVLENVKRCGYDIPTPIQAYVVPSVLQGNDIIGIAQTGSGKTAAFLIPIISKLMGKVKSLAAPRPDTSKGFTRDMSVRAEPLVLIVVPTRELAAQIFDEARRLCYRSMLRPCVAYGGAALRDQMEDLNQGCDILIGTPGRLVDILRRGSVLVLSRLQFTVIDEADELIQDDWQEEMEFLLNGDASDAAEHIFMMFSATFPPSARKLAKSYLSKDYIRVRVGRAGSSHANINQQIVFVEDGNKRTAVYDLLMSMPPTRVIIFVNSKKAADFLDDHLYNKGLPTTSIHSDRTQREREDALRAFKTGKAPVLVTTGVAARGLDITNVMHVINCDLPSMEHGGIDEYVHRIGRSGRMGNSGNATSLYSERNEDIAPELVKVLMETNQQIPEFLEQYLPEDRKLEFDDDSEKEDDGDADADGGGGGWGAAASGETEEAPAWGSADAAGDENGGTWGGAAADDDDAAWK